MSCQPPGCEAHGLKVGSAHGGGTTAPCTVSSTVAKTVNPDLILIFRTESVKRKSVRITFVRIVYLRV